MSEHLNIIDEKQNCYFYIMQRKEECRFGTNAKPYSDLHWSLNNNQCHDPHHFYCWGKYRILEKGVLSMY